MTRHEKGRGQAAAGLCVLETAAWARLASLVAAGELHSYARQLCAGASVGSAMPAFPPELHIRTIIIIVH